MSAIITMTGLTWDWKKTQVADFGQQREGVSHHCHGSAGCIIAMNGLHSPRK
jgi:hypothetical protein